MMNNQTGTDLVLRVAAENNFTQTQVDLIRNTVAQNCTDEEVAQLLITAHRTGLDPLARQIYMIKRWNSQLRREVAIPQTGIDGYRLIADRTGQYAPGRAPTFDYDADGNLVSATAYVKKGVGGTWHEVAATAFWSEYVQTKKNGEPTSMWLKMPHTMLSKCAESLALRKAFPADLSGLYTDDEMAQADNPDTVDASFRPAPVEVETAAAASSPPENRPFVRDAELTTIHNLGKGLYKGKWKVEGPKMVEEETEGRTRKSPEMYRSEAIALIKRLSNERKDRAAIIAQEQREAVA